MAMFQSAIGLETLYLSPRRARRLLTLETISTDAATVNEKISKHGKQGKEKKRKRSCQTRHGLSYHKKNERLTFENSA